MCTNYFVGVYWGDWHCWRICCLDREWSSYWLLMYNINKHNNTILITMNSSQNEVNSLKHIKMRTSVVEVIKKQLENTCTVIFRRYPIYVVNLIRLLNFIYHMCKCSPHSDEINIIAWKCSHLLTCPPSKWLSCFAFRMLVLD